MKLFAAKFKNGQHAYIAAIGFKEAIDKAFKHSREQYEKDAAKEEEEEKSGDEEPKSLGDMIFSHIHGKTPKEDRWDIISLDWLETAFIP